jgi:hypothetical protein
MSYTNTHDLLPIGSRSARGAAEARHAASREVVSSEDLFGRRLAARLDAGATDLPHDLSERLRAARVRAVAQRKRQAPVAVFRPQARLVGAGPSGHLDDRSGFWNRLASALPVLLLAAGLVCIQTLEADRRATEVAEVDAALLIDDLPPAAYADPGFAQYLKSEQ